MLTDRDMRTRSEGKDIWLTDPAPRGSGRLAARITPNEERLFYFRHFRSDGKRDNLPLGPYDPTGIAGLTLKAARARAGELAALYRAGIRDIREHLEREARATEEAARKADQARIAAAEAAQQGSLNALVLAYCDALEREAKFSARDTRATITLHLLEAFPNLCERRAADLRPADLRPVLAELIEDGKGRTAGKVRAILRAAYSKAIKAEHDPTAPRALLGFGIEHNPAAVLPALSQYNRPGERVLSVPELRAFLLALNDIRNPMNRAVLRLALLLGGQRFAQLLRVTPADVDLAGHTVTLRDPKGARVHPRLHVLPIGDEAAGLLAWALERHGECPSLFTSDGTRATDPTTLSAEVRAIAQAMVKAGTSPALFRMGDLRRTCETMLAEMGISSDVRAQLQSHGLGGVQARHYDRHGYMNEKRAALDAWARRLTDIINGTPAGSNVARIKRTTKGGT